LPTSMNSPAGCLSSGVFFAMFALTNFGFGIHSTPKAPDIHVGHKKHEEPREGKPFFVPSRAFCGDLHAWDACTLYRVKRLTALPAFSVGLLRVARRGREGRRSGTC
jgi:hypothetical protein